MTLSQPPVQISVDVKSVQARLDQRAAIDATRVVSVPPGYNTTTINAVVTTASGDEGMLMVLDEDGKLLAWKWTNQIQPIETGPRLHPRPSSRTLDCGTIEDVLANAGRAGSG